MPVYQRRAFHFTADAGSEGFLVAKVEREQGRFSIIADLYPTKGSYEIGNEDAVIACGQLTDEIRKFMPDLAQWLPMHLCDSETGEPMHGLENARYRLDPAGDFAHEMEYRNKGRKNYHVTGKDGGRYVDGKWVDSSATEDDIMEFIVGLAAKALKVDVNDLPDDLTDFDDFVDGLRPMWAERARQFNAWLAEQPEPSLDPAEVSTETFEHTFPNGLHVSAKLDEDEPEVQSPLVSSAYCYKYSVTVKWGDEEHTSSQWGSAMNHMQGFVDARGAAFSVLRELKDFGSDGAEELYDAMEWEEDDPRRAECNALGERFIDGIQDNMDIIGY